MNEVKKKESVKRILETFSRTTDSYFSLEDFENKLASGKQLRIKYGVDVTAPFLHLGHAVNLWMMRILQEHGHKVIFLIGDFTTMIGDPTGKSETRPIIARETIENNAEEFIRQVSKVLKTDDPAVFEIRRNSEWFENMPVREFMNLLSMVTHTRLISRDMFQNRIKEKKDIYLHEMLYPILQGYDSKMLFSDLTIVGSDQLFNEMMGKFFQEKFGQNSQIIITTKITQGLDGKNKQSKSLNNYIAITDTPKEKFGKVMSMPDNQIIDWMRVYTDLSIDNIKLDEQKLIDGENPKNIKKKLAFAIVDKYHGKDDAEKELGWFDKTFSQNEFPIDATEVKIDAGTITLLNLLKKCDNSRSNNELKRLVEQGAVKINNNTISNINETITFEESSTCEIKVGKRSYFKANIYGSN